jgi:hypothetical protein
MSATVTLSQDSPLRSSFAQFNKMKGVAAPSAESRQGSPLALRVALPVSGQNCYRLFSSKVQINSPYRIESELIQPFLSQQKKILLVPARISKIWASLSSVHENYLVAAADRTDRLLEERNSIVLVVFPVLPAQAYVLQTRISKLYVDRVTLEYQDPRYEPRRRFAPLAPLSLRVLPQEVGAAIEEEQLHLTRELSWLAKEPEASKEGYLTDLLYENISSPPSSPDSFSDMSLVSCRLRDISCGGISVSLTEDVPVEGFSKSLLLLHIPLPPVTVDSEGEPVAFTLKILGVIRAVRSVPSTLILHIQFLERLPDEFAVLFKQMERGGAPANRTWV